MIDLFIACPRHGDVRGEFAKSLARLAAYEVFDEGDITIHVEMPNSTNLCESRAKLVKQAIELGAQHILWADTDIVFPEQSASRLFGRNLDIVGCNYSRKSASRRPTAYRADMTGPVQPNVGIEEVAVIGFGLLLMRTEVFKTIKQPWFKFEHVGPDYETHGEDVWMCKQLRAEGHKIYVDHDLSREVSHIGEYPYTLREM